MNRQQAREYINSRSIYDYVPQLTRSKSGLYVCPICHSGTGPKGTGALQISKDGKHITCYAGKCFGEKGEDVLGALRIIWNTDENGVFKQAGLMVDSKDAAPAPAPRPAAPKKTPEPPEPRADYREYISKAHTALAGHAEATAYLMGRGLTQDTIYRFILGYDGKYDGVVIPYGTDGRYYIVRKLHPKDDNDKHRKPKREEAGPEPLYNPACLYKGDATAVFVVESPLCAISIMQEGGAAVAIGGTGTEKLLKQITTRPTKKTLVLSLDNDDTGHREQPKLAEKLTAAGVTFTEYNVAGTYKDPNEHLQKDRASFADAVKKGIEAAAAAEERAAAEKEKTRQERAYQFQARYSAAGRINAFIDAIDASIHNPPQPTGFDTLDGILDGGLYSGYAILTGGTSVGKTAFCLQLADNVAAAGRDVLYFTLEMTAHDLMARSISRLTFKNSGRNKGNAKTTRYITDATKRAAYSPAEEQLVAESTVEYADTIAPHIFFVEPRQRDKDFLSTDDIKAVLEEYTAGMKPGAQGPLVIVDYAQLLRPGESEKPIDTKQNMSNAATVLYHISKEYNVPLLAITSQPRSNYGKNDSMNAGKESGDLEYSAEYLFRLQFPRISKADYPDAQQYKYLKDNPESYEKEQKRKDPRTVHLAIMKNRSGTTGDTIAFRYTAKFNHFAEAGLADDDNALDDVD